MNNDIKVGDVFEAVYQVEFVQPPLFRVLRKGQKLWVKEVGKFWPVFEKDDGDYAIFGEVCNELIYNGSIKKIRPLEFPFEYYKTLHHISVLVKQLNEQRNKLKKFISENNI